MFGLVLEQWTNGVVRSDNNERTDGEIEKQQAEEGAAPLEAVGTDVRDVKAVNHDPVHGVTPLSWIS